MSVSYEYYKIFYYVAKHRSFNKAAAVLENSQPNISRTINHLEEYLGCKLFTRSSRGVTLTEAGKELFTHVEAAHEHLQKGEEKLLSFKELKSGSLTIGLSIGIPSHMTKKLILPAIKEFRERYPEIEVHLVNTTTPKIIHDFKDGLTDVAIITTSSKKKISIDKTIIHSYHDMLIAGPSYSDLKNRTVSLKELKGYPFISLPYGTETFAVYNDLFAEYNMEYRPSIEAAHTFQLVSYISENLGIGFSDTFTPEDLFIGNGLFEVSLKEKLPVRYIALADDIHKEKSPAAKKFTELLIGKTGSKT
ncbi:MAG: LysR family transcriptional regulator [Lachnospiraceae bacterium]|nr:LysR family transcriptional regulator [Lachnospiraceae bacterium]